MIGKIDGVEIDLSESDISVANYRHPGSTLKYVVFDNREVFFWSSNLNRWRESSLGDNKKSELTPIDNHLQTPFEEKW